MSTNTDEVLVDNTTEKTETPSSSRLVKIKCTILPVMNNVTISIPENETLNYFDNKFTRECGAYIGNIIFRGEILENYMLRIDELDLRKNDMFFIIKKPLSNTLFRSSSSQTSSLLRRFLNVGHGLEMQGETVTVDYELTDGETTYTSSALSTLENSLNQLFASSTLPPLVPLELPNLTTTEPVEPAAQTAQTTVTTPSTFTSMTELPAVPEYEYQSQLQQILNMGYVDEIDIRAALDITNGNVADSLIYL